MRDLFNIADIRGSQQNPSGFRQSFYVVNQGGVWRNDETSLSLYFRRMVAGAPIGKRGRHDHDPALSRRHLRDHGIQSGIDFRVAWLEQKCLWRVEISRKTVVPACKQYRLKRRALASDHISHIPELRCPIPD